MNKESDNLVQEAKQASESGNLGVWLLGLLKKTEANNTDLINLIAKKKDELRGPELIPLKEIKRTFGPEKNMLHRESQSEFNRRVAKIQKAIVAGFQPAPLLIEKSSQGLVLLDGNHTFEALKVNHTEYWAIYYSGNDITKLGEF
jgi:hypothetical protein